MKKIILPILLAFLLSACNGWIIQPLPGPTPFLPSTPTPSIFTPTPVVIGVTSVPTTLTPTATGIIPTNTNAPIATNTETVVPVATLTSSPTGPSILIKVLGCNTSIDVLHSMGEVTNAFVTLKNTGGVDLTNLTATLFALDEGRVHPDKTIEITSLPVGYQVTLKLTVDSTYQQKTPIQVEVSGDGGLFQRVGADSCTDIGIFAPNPDALNTPIPNAP